MLPRNLGSSQTLQAALQRASSRSLSQRKLYQELAKTGTRPDLLPKTYPYEVRENPVTAPDRKRDELDQRVLKALAKASEKAKATGSPGINIKMITAHNIGKGKAIDHGINSGAEKPRQAGITLAEQFIAKYPESFKIRYSDKMSRSPDCSHIEALCRDLKLDQLHVIVAEVLRNERTISWEDANKLIIFFAERNTAHDNNDWPLFNDANVGAPFYKWTDKEFTELIPSNE